MLSLALIPLLCVRATRLTISQFGTTLVGRINSERDILSDKYEKQILESKIAILTKRLERAEEYGESILSKEFVRPTDTRMENKKRKYN